MSDELFHAGARILSRLRALIAADPDLRADLRRLGEAILDVTRDEPGAGAAPPQHLPQSPAMIAAALETADALRESSQAGTFRQPDEELPPLLLGAASPEPAEAPADAWTNWSRTGQRVSDDELAWIEKRSRLKAEGTRWAFERVQRINAGADFRTEIEPMDRTIIETAKSLPDCFLWMNHPSGPSPTDGSALEDLAGCFEAMAAAIGLLRSLASDPEANREVFEKALDLAAEAQSAVRAAIGRIDERKDPDQQKAYLWLREATAREQIFIQRHMRTDDAAEPGNWADLASRISELDNDLQAVRQRGKRFQSGLNRIRYHLKRIRDSGSTDHDWQQVIVTTDALVADGLPPSNREIRDLLLPLVESLPEQAEPPDGFRLVLREIDRYLASHGQAIEAAAAIEPTPEVAEAARLLRGQTIVLIGGHRRTNAKRQLEQAFGLAELIWIETREHQSIEGFEPYVARPDVALVILAIRWSSHSFGEVRRYCEQHGKPLVRLPAGYNPNQVAVQVLAQCSGKLSAIGYQLSARRDQGSGDVSF